jgi:hypothetical protein
MAALPVSPKLYGRNSQPQCQAKPTLAYLLFGATIYSWHTRVTSAVTSNVTRSTPAVVATAAVVAVGGNVLTVTAAR